MACSKAVVFSMVLSCCVTSFLYELFRVSGPQNDVNANIPLNPNWETQFVTRDEVTVGKTYKERFFEKAVDDYIILHNQIMQGKKPARFAKGDIGHGWGNVFQMGLSYLLYGMITQRAVVFFPLWAKDNFFHKNFDEFFERPPIDLMHYPKDLLTRHNDHTEKFVGTAHSVACSNISANNAEMIELMSPGLYDFWAPVLIHQNNNWLSGKIPPNWFKILCDKLLRPKKEIRDFVDEFKRKHFAEYNVGLQIRVWMGAYGTDSVVLPKIPVDVFLQAAEVVSVDYPVPEEKVRFFLATTDKDYIQRAINIYGKDKIIYVPEENPDAASVNGTKIGLAIMYLLGDCDDILTTEVSSYGTNAAAIAGKKPIMCTHERLCYRRLTAEPCQFEPFPIQRSGCSPDGKNQFLPGIQSTCAYFSNQIFSRKWHDFYNSWKWVLKNDPNYITWKVGDDHGHVYD